MTEAAKPLIVTMGDPAGCGPQITCKAWKDLRNSKHRFCVLGDPRLYESEVPITRISQTQEAVAQFEHALPVLPLSLPEFDALEVGEPNPLFAKATIESIHLATSKVLDGAASALVTNPISKAVLYGAGFRHPGHTEFIAEICEQRTAEPVTPVMMLVGGGLRVALVTIHVPLMTVMDHLTRDRLETVARITHRALQRDFGLAEPRIAFTGLNPHAGESGTIGTEERDTINPLAKDLRASGIEISDARPADTVFHEALSGTYDAVIAMTHDQGLIPVKTLDIWGGVNTTLGLPIIRTSPDHGTAYDAAATNNCRADSLIAAIKLASKMSHTRQTSSHE